MDINQLKPSHFKQYPWDPIARKSESEVVARNINVIRARLGDTWVLERDQYQQEREKDGGFTSREMDYFDSVIGLISSPAHCIKFCNIWNLAATKLINGCENE